MFTFRLKSAFAATEAHPLDVRVRVTDTPKGLAAIFSKEVRAIIWRRGLPRHIASDFDAMDFARIDGRRSINTPYIKSTIFGTNAIRHRDAHLLSLPPSILNDMCEVSDYFRRAKGVLKYETAKFMDLLNCYNFTDQYTEEEFSKAATPHIDGAFCPRLITTYATDPGMGTVWYPGTFSSKALYDFKQELLQTSNPEAMLMSFDEKNGAQSIAPGDVMLIKGMAKGVSQDEILAHRSAIPIVNVRRAALVIS